LCCEAEFQGFYTNHSLRATAATRLFEAGVEDQLIVGKLDIGLLLWGVQNGQ